MTWVWTEWGTALSGQVLPRAPGAESLGSKPSLPHSESAEHRALERKVAGKSDNSWKGNMIFSCGLFILFCSPRRVLDPGYTCLCVAFSQLPPPAPRKSSRLPSPQETYPIVYSLKVRSAGQGPHPSSGGNQTPALSHGCQVLGLDETLWYWCLSTKNIIKMCCWIEASNILDFKAE